MTAYKEVKLSEEEIKFDVYTKYLRGLAYVLSEKYKSYHDIEKAINRVENKNLDNFERDTDFNSISKYLNNAWNSERVLNLPKESGTDTFFIKFANHWSPVLAYYSIFLCFQSLLLAIGENVKLEHRPFLQKVSSLMRKKSGDVIFIYPWNLFCEGCVYYGKPRFNYEVDIEEVMRLSVLGNPELADKDVLIAKILKTTREREEIYLERKWKKEGKFTTKGGKPKQNYGKKEKEEVSKNLASTSILNFLYRLRIRSNYEDADIFFVGSKNDADIENYFNSIILITDYTMLLIETNLKNIIGENKFTKLVEKFYKDSGNYKLGVIARHKFR